MDTLTSEAREALAATSTEDLLTKAYALTHRMGPASRRPPNLFAAEKIADLRAQRDLITAEVLRRAGA